MSLLLLSTLHKMVRQIGLHLKDQLHPLGLHATEGHLLSYLAKYAPCPVGELQRVFGVKQSTLTSILSRLEKRDLLSRTLNPDDRRSLLVHLTPEGVQLAEAVNNLAGAFEAQLKKQLSDADLATLHKIARLVDQTAQVAVRPTTPAD